MLHGGCLGRYEITLGTQSGYVRFEAREVHGSTLWLAFYFYLKVNVVIISLFWRVSADHKDRSLVLLTVPAEQFF